MRNGTPTNNTDAAVSGWRPPSTEVEQLFAIEDKPPDMTPAAGPLGETDGQRLVRLLGLSEEFVRRLPNATATDIAEALAMNRAASFATIFEFVKEFLNPLVGAPTRRELRDFFHQHVSGRGALPAIRVGRQPYGIVVTSDWSRWTRSRRSRRAGADRAAAARRSCCAPAGVPAMAIAGPRPARRGAKPFARLMLIVGQLASSAQYVSRTAVHRSSSVIEAAGARRAPRGDAQDEWINELERAARPNLEKSCRDRAVEGASVASCSSRSHRRLGRTDRRSRSKSAAVGA